MVNTFFHGIGPPASWAVAMSGIPTGYGVHPNANYALAWNVTAPLRNNMQGFLDWLDVMAPGWDANLQSTFP